MEHGGLRLINNPPDYSRKSGDGPLFTVITAVLNGEKTLEKTIESVIGQTWKKIEFIVIDGGSTDNTLGILKQYEGFIDYWISEPDRGIADAFNKGVNYSTGDYISFLGSDDWYESDALTRIAQSLRPGTDIYTGHANLWSSDGCRFVKFHKSRPERIFQTMRIAHAAAFVSRNVFEQTGTFSADYKIAMDYDFLLRAGLNGFKFFVVESVIVNILTGGISQNIVTASLEELRIKNHHLGRKPGHYLWLLAYIFAWYILTAFKRN
ncbi:MAG TPA: glycosyltransferase family 2 protein [Bacteroidales bacterium]|jgi:glycosyltransferase involved in cell wall biosynthesis|nr:glycosyltransferase family 2 protein [Bacteroidales bacterium]